MSYSRRSWCMGALLVLLGGFGVNAYAAPVGSCPDGFELIPSGAACAATKFAGSDGSFAGLVAEPSSGGGCPAGFERPLGVKHCVAANMAIWALGTLPVLEPQTSRFCPEGFHRQPGSSICVASNLLLKLQTDGAVLVGPATGCPVGFIRPTGSTICVAGTAQAALQSPIAAHCPPGFHRPPGVAICIAKDIVYSSAVLPNVTIPPGACPKNWHRPEHVKFCIPSYEQAFPTPGSSPARAFTGNLCPTGTHEIWFDMPMYDAETGLWVIGFVPTRFCIPDNLEVAG